MAAVVRGRHSREDPPPWVLDDPFALALVGPTWRKMAAASDARFSDELSRQMRAALATRSRYAEDRLGQGHFTQYVVLGAGLDSFAWRRPEVLGTLRLYEVDHPSSQAWKRGRLAELGLAITEHHVFAPVDFEVASLDDGLAAAGFDPGAPTLFSWLGVVPYLTRGAVEATLRSVAGCRSGSEVVLEYGLTEAEVDAVAREFMAAFPTVAERVGEPVQRGWSRAEAEAVVGRCGLVVADHPSLDDLVGRYFAGRDDGLRPWSVSGLMTAAVP
jgi:methyltransferase (TIGR00027 family)